MIDDCDCVAHRRAEDNLGIFFMLMAQLRRRFPPADNDEFESDLAEVYMRVCSCYDETRGVKFSAYLVRAFVLELNRRSHIRARRRAGEWGAAKARPGRVECVAVRTAVAHEIIEDAQWLDEPIATVARLRLSGHTWNQVGRAAGCAEGTARMRLSAFRRRHGRQAED